MKLAILQNSDVMEKNQYRIRIQRPKISKDLLVSFDAQKKVQFRSPVLYVKYNNSQHMGNFLKLLKYEGYLRK